MNGKIARSLSSEVEEIWKKYYVNTKTIIYKDVLLWNTYVPVADSIESFEVYDNDTWICGFPKSGTCWATELVWNIEKDLDFESAKADLNERVPLLDRSLFGYKSEPDGPAFPADVENSIEFAKNLSRPRFIKTHLPFHLLPRQLQTNEKKAKIVYVWRNPKDLCISHYHFSKWSKKYSGDFTHFTKLFLNDGVIYMPYWNHIIEFWNRRNEGNILILKYEDMKTDLPSAIKRTASFFGKNLNDEQISKLVNHLSFSSMSTNTSVNYESIAKLYNLDSEGKFMRKGEANQWKTEMSSEMIDQFDAWIHENLKNNESLLRELS